MELTGIGKENERGLAPLMFDTDIEACSLGVGAIEEGEAAGVALYSELAGSLILDYIYVPEKFRRKGIATALVEETVKQLQGSGLVALHVNYPESAEDIHGFILSRGFKIFRDGTAYRARVGDFMESKVTKRLLSGSLKNRVVRVADLTRYERNSLRKALKAQDLDPSVIDDRTLSRQLSLANFDPVNKNPAGLVLCRLRQKVVTISYLVNFSNDPLQLKEILMALMRAAEEQNIRDHELIFLTMNDDMVKLPQSLLKSKDLLHREGAVISGIRMLLPERRFFGDILKQYGFE